MTEQDFKLLLARLCPEAATMLSHRIGLARVVDSVAIHCFTNQIENEDTDVLRYQLRHAGQHGYFDLERKEFS